jgi:NADH-quinone oxidoreductase subunit J
MSVWMDPAILPYLACLLGAAAIFLLLWANARPIKAAGIVLGIAAFAGLLAEVSKKLGIPGNGQGDARPGAFFVIFSLIAVASAVRMITHHKPVYSALYFIMVVLSSAGLFLLLQAEFMAFALVIVYAGAILITYMFVLMLAQQTPEADNGGSQPAYDTVPREPLAAAIVGCIMLAIFTNMVFVGTPELTPSTGGGSAGILPSDASASNVQAVGVDLVHAFPVSLELAGVILLMAMFGAVVLARKQIELGEDEIREAAGMTRLGLHADEADHAHASPSRGSGGGKR